MCKMTLRLFLICAVLPVFDFQQDTEYNMKHCLEAGLWTNTGKWTKDDTTETEDMRMMEIS